MQPFVMQPSVPLSRSEPAFLQPLAAVCPLLSVWKKKDGWDTTRIESKWLRMKMNMKIAMMGDDGR